MSTNQTKKDQLLEAGLDVFFEKTFERATIDDIVGRAACGKGTFYRYFSNKESLFDELEARFRDLMTNELKKNCPETMPLKEFLNSALKTFVRLFKMHQRLGLVKFARDQQLGKTGDHNCPHKNPPSIDYLRAYLEKALAAKTVRPVRIDAMVAVMLGSAHFYLFRDFKLGIPFTESELEDTVDIILNGVLPL